MIVWATWKWLHIFYDWRLVKTISSFWASFKLLYFNDDNCFPAIPNKSCCLGTECGAVIQPQGFTAIHILLMLLFQMPAESHAWFTHLQSGDPGLAVWITQVLPCASPSISHHVFFSSNQFIHPSLHIETSLVKMTLQSSLTPHLQGASVISMCFCLPPLLKTTFLFGHMSLHF